MPCSAAPKCARSHGTARSASKPAHATAAIASTGATSANSHGSAKARHADRNVRRFAGCFGLPRETAREHTDSTDEERQDDGSEYRGHRTSSTTKSP